MPDERDADATRPPTGRPFVVLAMLWEGLGALPYRSATLARYSSVIVQHPAA